MLCVTVNVLDFDMDARAAVDAPRLHHQWFPDELRLERGADRGLTEKLRALGHKVLVGRQQGDAHTILVDPQTGLYRGAADERIRGAAAGY